MNITGGATSLTPKIITTQNSYLGLSPAGANIYYQLPNPATCPGRIYYVRNNDNSVNAQLGTVAGFICPGSSNCLGAGAYLQLNSNSPSKTLICISDGINWTVGKID